jgi:hypothetical protein
MKFVRGFFLILCLVFGGASAIGKNEPGNTILTKYQQDVISYFKDVALGFEYGSASPITRKWKKDIRIFAGGAVTPTLTNEIQVVADELNDLITDDLTVEIVTEREQANVFIFFGSGEEYGTMFPVDSKLAKSNSGVYRIFWNKQNEITSGRIFVNTTKIGIVEQRHVIREELTQALGLGRDSFMFPESIFQSSYTTPTQYADVDKEIIRLLYHPKISIGLRAEEVEAVLTDILLNEGGA